MKKKKNKKDMWPKAINTYSDWKQNLLKGIEVSLSNPVEFKFIRTDKK